MSIKIEVIKKVSGSECRYRSNIQPLTLTQGEHLFYTTVSLLSLQALEEKEKGNAAYKTKNFETALEHYGKAIELDPLNITFRTNRAGKLNYTF